MPNDDEITLSEAKRVTAELKASILKLDALNQEVINNITQLQELNSKLNSYTQIINKFEYSDEDKLISNYSAHLTYLSRKIDELVSNSSIKKLEKILNKSNSVINFSILKLIITITICISAFYALTKI